MSLFRQLRSRLVAVPSAANSRAAASDQAGQAGQAASALAEAERLLRRGGRASAIRAAAGHAQARQPVEQAWRALFLGDLEAALEPAYAAATAQPYDVDSRIVHGTVRLARNDLNHAEHEFDAVIEEFGAESDAADGRRATILARGFAPLDELPAGDAEWESAAVLLTTLWRIAGVAEARLAALSGGHPDGLAILLPALTRGQAIDLEADNGAV